MLGTKIREILDEIRRDNLSGSLAVCRRAAELYERLAGEKDPPESGLWEIRSLSQEILASQRSMAPLAQLVNHVLWALEGCSSQREVETASEAASAFVREIFQRQDKIAETFSTLIPNRALLLTHSAGSTVENTVLALHRGGMGIRLILTESRPMLEGAHMARRLAEAGVACQLMIDALAFSVLKDVDAVVVGGDAVLEQGLINKAGTLGLAIAAKEFSKPFWALAGREKFMPRGLPFSIAEMPPDEVLAESLPRLSVINRYFDLTPLRYLTGIVTDLGSIPALDLQTRDLRLRLSLPPAHPALVRLAKQEAVL
jgi:translation initiation factor 2B subunit (eIF-2B alpha/beta/delta family)